MPIRVWKEGGQWCAKWGDHGKTYCRSSREEARGMADRQARAAYSKGYRGTGLLNKARKRSQ